MRDPVTLVLSTPPTPNGPLHVGHLSGPYIAADIAVRAARAEGRAVVSVCGLDPHQNYVLARAESDGTSPEVALDKYGSLVRDAMAVARIDHDVFFEPDTDTAYRQGVVRVLDGLLERGAATVEDTTVMRCAGCGRTLHHVRVAGRCPSCGEGASGGTCEGCGSFVTAATLIDARSTCCQADPTPAQQRIPVLHLERWRAELTQVWARAQVPSRVRTLLAGYLDHGLPAVPLAYETDWGIRWGDLRVDVWAEMAFGYVYGIARHLTGTDPTDLAACAAGWSGVAGMWNFFGIDNAFYYTVLNPAVMTAAGLDPGLLRGVVVNEFYRLDGLKFSTSRDHAIWAHEFLAAEDPAVVRAYLSWERPDRSSTDFTRAGYEAFKQRWTAVMNGPGSDAPRVLAEKDADRAAQALRLESFDPAVAVRCVLDAHQVDPALVAGSLAALTGA
ncbi:class I tRNA ligase family protein [Pseudonocardia sp. CA-107938]|uniref:class I tRNA ligase family protein n=1 Tax=Pseudonocardia sp. CA-107938 TaxID=3240021 RepID=UPI003D8F5591